MTLVLSYVAGGITTVLPDVMVNGPLSPKFFIFILGLLEEHIGASVVHM